MATEQMIEMMRKGFNVTIQEKDAEIARLSAEIADLKAQLAARPTLLTPQALMSTVPTSSSHVMTMSVNPFDDLAGDSSGDESTISVKTTVTTKRKPRVGVLPPVVKGWERELAVNGEVYKITKKSGVYEVNGKNVDSMKGQERRDVWAVLHMGKTEGSTSTTMAPNVELLVRIIKKKIDMMEIGNDSWAPTTDFNAIQESDNLWRGVTVYKKGEDGEKMIVSSGNMTVKRVDAKTGVQIMSSVAELNGLLGIKYKSLYLMQKAVSAELLKSDLYWNNCNNVLGAWRVKRDGKDYPLEEIYTLHSLSQMA
jgi:hypothetical protein